MGQASSLGKLSKKGQVAPVGGPAAAPQDGNRGGGPGGQSGTPVIGKRYPTYFYTTLLSSFPFSCLLVFISVPFLMSCYSTFSQDTNELDTMLESFEISDHITIKSRDVTTTAVSDWKRALDAYDYERTSTTQGQSLDLGKWNDYVDIQEPPPGSIPWKRLYIQYKVDLQRIYTMSECDFSGEDKPSMPTENLKDFYNLLTNKRFMRFMHEVEDLVRSRAGFESVCFRSADKAGNKKFTTQGYKDYAGDKKNYMPCAPFTSVKQYYYPGDLEKEPYNEKGDKRYFWNFDSTKDTGSPYWESANNAMQTPDDQVLGSFYQNPAWKWFGDSLHDATNKQTFMLRTQITLGRPIENIYDSDTAEKVVDYYLKDFIRVMDHIVARTKHAQGHPEDQGLGISGYPPGLTVSYGGDGLVESQLKEAQDRDWWFVFIGVVIVLLLIGAYTHSFFIATMSVCQMALTYFTGTFIHFYSRDEKLSLLTLLSFYIMMSMSTDGVMVFFNTFRQSAFMETNGRVNTLNIPQRMAFCFRKAGASIVMSHLAAGCAFIVNTVSAVPAIQDFGVFMVWLVVVNLYMFLTVFPCVLLLHHFHISRKRRNAQRQKEILLRRRVHFHPTSVRTALRQLDTQSKKGNGAATAYLNLNPRGSIAPGECAPPPPPEAGAAPPGDGAGDAADANKPQVSFGEAGSRFGFSKLQAKLMKKRTPKTSEQIKAEHEAIFEQFSSTGALRPQRSRRKQAPNGILQIPIEFTAFARGAPRAVKCPQGSNPASNTEPVSLETYRDRYRAIWEEDGRAMGPTTFLGKGVYRDPVSQHLLESAKRIPMVAQTLAEYQTELRVVKQPYGDNDEVEMIVDASGGDAVAVQLAPEGQQQPTGFEAPPLDGGVPQGGDPAQQGQPVMLSYTPVVQQPAPAGLWDRFLNWVDERRSVRRRFGVFGKRIGETREQKDRRILGKRAKREGYTSIERFFYNRYTPLIAMAFPFIITAYLIKLIIFAGVLLAKLEATPETPQLLAFQDQIYDYEENRKLFPVEGSCDYCGAWFRPYTDFPAPFGRGSPNGVLQDEKVSEWASCNYQMFSPMDSCGVCGGDNSCLDCLGQKSQCVGLTTEATCTARRCEWKESVRKGVDGHCIDSGLTCGGITTRAGWTFDDCKVCVLPGYSNVDVGIHSSDPSVNSNSCNLIRAPQHNACENHAHQCRSVHKLNHCNRCYVASWLAGNAQAELRSRFPAPIGQPGEPGYDPRCNVVCNEATCNKHRGRCDSITGECVCHSNYIDGFWDHAVPYDPEKGQSGDCNVCLSGFQPGPSDPSISLADGIQVVPMCTLECTTPPKGSGALQIDEDCECLCDLKTPPEEFNSIHKGDRGRCMCTKCRRIDYGNGTNPLNISDASEIPRYGSLDWSERIVAVGYNCTSKRRERCDNGTMDHTTGECTCNDDFNDGGNCSLQESCSLHGKRDSSGRCMCHGCWEGDRCERSVCKNSGVCDGPQSGKPPHEWKCNCGLGVWEGADCSACPDSCRNHSRCPLQWPANMYNPLGAGANIPDKFLTCWVSDTKRCHGYWSGESCNVCTPPPSVPSHIRGSVTCDAKGDVYGCDGAAATDTHFKWIDACQTCTDILRADPNDQSHCKGCDGVQGSGKVADSCGVCGGSNTCNCIYQAASAPEPTPVELVWGLIPMNVKRIREAEWGYGEIGISTSSSKSLPLDLLFEFKDPAVQAYLKEVCHMLISKAHEGYISQLNRHCLMFEFSLFLERNFIKTRGVDGLPLELYPCTSSNNCDQQVAFRRQNLTAEEASYTNFEKLTFPVKSRYATWVLFQFVQAEKSTHLVGFSSSNPYAVDLRVNWIRMQFTLPEHVADGRTSTRQNYKHWENLVASINARGAGGTDPLKYGRAFHWSPLWIRYFTKEQSENGTIYAIVLGCICFAAMMLVFSCSLTLTLLAIFNVSGIIIMSMSYMKAAGWYLGPAEQVGLTCLVGLATEYTVHLTEGYLEYLHASQSSLLARKTTRTHALAGALQRTGVPIAVSSFAVLCASLMILFCEILVYRRIAEIMIMVTLLSAFHGLVIFPAFLVFIGPITVQRNWTTRTLWAATVGLCICFSLAIIFLSDNAKDPNGDDLI